MTENRLEVVGVRESGQVAGFVLLTGLDDGPCGSQMEPFEDEQIVMDTTSVADLVLRLKDRRRLFVSTLGRVGGIVSRTDLQKPPVRMWLFGMVTLIEMRFHRLIDRYCPNESWQQFVSPGRLQKAKELLAERSRRNQELTLLDCLQLSDKATVFARNPELRSLTRFESRRQLEEAAKMIEKLRNNLAHSQDIITNDWDTIVSLSENLDTVLEGPQGLHSDS